MAAGVGKDNRKIYKGNRRRKVAALLSQGMSQRAIAEELGIGKSTVARDVKFLKESEHLLRAQDVADEVASAGDTDIILVDVPTSIEEYRQQERLQVIDMVEKRYTYEQIAARIGISVRTVLRHVNSYLAEYGDWGGRTMLDWRNEQLMKSYQMMAELDDDMSCQPIVSYDADGDESGWDLTPFQASRTRQAARKQYVELMQHQARLLQLLVQKTEIDIEQRVVVANLRNVDLSAFPPQTLVMENN